MNTSLDTNIVLRMIVGDIPAQEKAARQLIEGSEGMFGIADLVFIEIEYALHRHYGLTRQQIKELISSFITHPKINCNRELFTRALSMYQHRPALSFTDICLAVYADLNDYAPLWTFDKKLARQLDSARLVQ